MRSANTTEPNLPIGSGLVPTSTFTLLIAILMAAASVFGLFWSHRAYSSQELYRTFVPNDAVNLCVGLPMLVVPLLLARRGSLIGLLCLPGALLFVLYSYLVYLFAVPLNAGFPLYLALVGLSTYTLVSLLAHTDSSAVRELLKGAVHERAAGGILTVLGVLFLVRALVVLVRGVIQHMPVAKTELAVGTSDLLITPAWIICGVLLFRKRTFGYVAGLGPLYQASGLFIGLIVFLFLQPILMGTPFRPTDVAIILVAGSICFVPLTLFVRGARKATRNAANDTARPGPSGIGQGSL